MVCPVGVDRCCTGLYHESDTLILTAALVINLLYCPRLQETHSDECLFCFVYLAVHVHKIESVNARFKKINKKKIKSFSVFFFTLSVLAYLSD